MAILNTKTTYGFISKFFHWIMAIMIIVTWLLGKFNDDVGDLKRAFIITHYTLGITIFLMVGFRLMWRWLNIKPDHLLENKILNKISSVVFTLFYSLMFIIPLSGYVLMNLRGRNPVYFGYEIPALLSKNDAWKGFAKETHEILGMILLILFVLHVVAALYHHYIRKDQTLTRMSFK